MGPDRCEAHYLGSKIEKKGVSPRPQKGIIESIERMHIQSNLGTTRKRRLEEIGLERERQEGRTFAND